MSYKIQTISMNGWADLKSEGEPELFNTREEAEHEKDSFPGDPSEYRVVGADVVPEADIY